MQSTRKLSEKNLTELAWKNGFRGATGLAQAIGKNRVTLYKAVRNPKRYGPTHRSICQALKLGEPHA